MGRMAQGFNGFSLEEVVWSILDKAGDILTKEELNNRVVNTYFRDKPRPTGSKMITMEIKIANLRRTWRRFHNTQLAILPIDPAPQHWDRFHKNHARDWAIAVHGQAAKTAVFLPSDEFIDILLALKEGRINRSTFIIAIESDTKKISQIRDFLNRNFDNHYLHHGKAHTLNLAEVTKYAGKIDFAFFDFCGELTDDLCAWLETLHLCCTKDAKVAFTFTNVNRCNPFMEKVDNKLDILQPQLKKYLNGMLWQPIVNAADNMDQHKGTLPTLFALTATLADKFKMEVGWEYRDGTKPMLLFLTTRN